METIMKPWLAEFSRLELQGLLRMKNGDSKSESYKTPNILKVERKYRRTSGGLKICCKDGGDADLMLQLVKWLDTSDVVVSATVADSACSMNAKFSHAVRTAWIDTQAIDLISLRKGTLLKILDFEWQLTLYGDEAWHISLLINDFRSIGAQTIESPNSATLIDTGDISKLLGSLLRDHNGRNNPNASASEVNNVTIYVNSDSDIASQEEQPLSSQKIIASQTTFATQAPSKFAPDLDILGGVNLSAPQAPRKQARRVDSNGSDKTKINPTAQQLLSLLSRQSSTTRLEPTTQTPVMTTNTVEFEPNLDITETEALESKHALESKTDTEALHQAKLERPRRTENSSTPRRLRQMDYLSTHRGNFDFVLDAIDDDGPDDEQKNLLRLQSSWHNHEPGLQSPELNIPVDIFTSFKSRSEAIVSEAIPTRDTGAPIDSETNADHLIATTITANLVSEGSFATALEEDASCVPSDEPETPSTEVYEWPPSDPSSVAVRTGGYRNEPRDSSVEEPERRELVSNRMTSGNKKRPSPPSSPIRDFGLEKRPKIGGSTLTPANVDDPGWIARRAKREFLSARRTAQLHAETRNTSSLDPFSEASGESDAEKHVSATASEIVSSPSFPSSPPVLDSPQRLMLRAMSPEIITGSPSIRSSGLQKPLLPDGEIIVSQNPQKSSQEHLESYKEIVSTSLQGPSSTTSINSLEDLHPRSSQMHLENRDIMRNDDISQAEAQNPEVVRSQTNETLSNEELYYSSNSGLSPMEQVLAEQPDGTRRSQQSIHDPEPDRTPKSSASTSSRKSLPWPATSRASRRNMPLLDRAPTQNHLQSSQGSETAPKAGEPLQSQRSSGSRFTPAKERGTSVAHSVNDGAFDIAPTSRPEIEHQKPPAAQAVTNQWWKTDDTVFKSFARDYASLKVLDGSLGKPGEQGVLVLPQKNLELLEWRFSFEKRR